MGQLEQQFRLADIEVSRATTDDTIIGLFRFQTETKNKKPATIVILVEIFSSLYVYEQLLDVMNATAEQVRVLTISVEGDPMARFEKLVQRLNDAIATFVDREPTSVVWNRVNAFVLQFMEGQVCLTGLGRLTNLFVQKQKDGGYKSFDLLGSLEQPEEVNPHKPFASLICGDIAPGDALFIGTSNFERLRSEIGIADKLKTLPPVTAALEIKQALEHKTLSEDFAGVVVASVLLPQAAPAPAAPSSETPADLSTRSIERMAQAEKSTKEILTASPTTSMAPEERTMPLPPKKRAPLQPLAWVTTVANRFKAPKKMAGTSTSPRSSVIKDSVTMVGLRSMHAGHGTFLTTARKIQIGVGIVLLIGGLVGYRSYSKSKQFAEEQRLWNAVFDQASDYKNRADAAIVYNNEDNARNQIREAERLLAGLDEKTPERASTKQKLSQDLKEVGNKLKRELRNDNPVELGALALGSPENSLKTVSVLKNTLFAVDGPGQTVIQIDLGNRSVVRSPLPADVGMVRSAVSGLNDVLFLTEARKLFSVTPGSEKVTSLDLASTKASSTMAIAYYNKRLYALDSMSGMIWRYTAAGKGFGTETAYLREPTASLGTALAIAGDASLYVGLTDGQLKRFLSGAEEAWSVSPIDPPVTSLSSIWTDPTSDRIVATDPSGKRVLVYRKTDGKLVAQVVSSQFQSPNYVTADAATKKMYVVDNNRILVLDLP